MRLNTRNPLITSLTMILNLSKKFYRVLLIGKNGIDYGLILARDLSLQSQEYKQLIRFKKEDKVKMINIISQKLLQAQIQSSDRIQSLS